MAKEPLLEDASCPVLTGSLLNKRVFHPHHFQREFVALECTSSYHLASDGHRKVFPFQFPFRFVRFLCKKCGHGPICVQLQPFPVGVHSQTIQCNSRAEVLPQIVCIRIPCGLGIGGIALTGGKADGQSTDQEETKEFFFISFVLFCGMVFALYSHQRQLSTEFL